MVTSVCYIECKLFLTILSNKDGKELIGKINDHIAQPEAVFICSSKETHLWLIATVGVGSW